MHIRVFKWKFSHLIRVKVAVGLIYGKRLLFNNLWEIGRRDMIERLMRWHQWYSNQINDMHTRVFKWKFPHFDQSEGSRANIQKKAFVFQSLGNWKKEYNRKIDEMTPVILQSNKQHAYSIEFLNENFYILIRVKTAGLMYGKRLLFSNLWEIGRRNTIGRLMIWHQWRKINITNSLILKRCIQSN